MAKTPTNASRAKATLAKKVETPAEAQKPETGAKTGGAPAPDKVSGTTGLEPDTTSQGQADAEGKTTAGTIPTDQATAAQGVAAVGGNTANDAPTSNSNPNESDVFTSEDIQKIRDEAYREGYTNGFSEALDQQAEGNQPNPDAPSPDDMSWAEGNTLTDPEGDRARLVALALFTPESQRKGGISPMVDRMESYLNGIAPEDRYYALQMMGVIGQTKPMDLATGRFTRVVTEGLAAIRGEAPQEGSAADRAQEAAARFDRAFQQEDESEEARQDPVDQADLEDPDSAAAAAARLGRL